MPVYFIQEEEGPIKIGFSESNPHGRLRTFKTGNPRVLKLLVTIPGSMADEKALHERFKDIRVRPDGEWFHPHARLLGFIEAMQYAYREQQPMPPVSESPFTAVQLRFLSGYIRAELDYWLTYVVRDHAIEEDLDSGAIAGRVPEFAADLARSLRHRLTTSMRFMDANCVDDVLPGSSVSLAVALDEVNDIISVYNDQGGTGEEAGVH